MTNRAHVDNDDGGQQGTTKQSSWLALASSACLGLGLVLAVLSVLIWALLILLIFFTAHGGGGRLQPWEMAIMLGPSGLATSLLVMAYLANRISGDDECDWHRPAAVTVIAIFAAEAALVLYLGGSRGVDWPSWWL